VEVLHTDSIWNEFSKALNDSGFPVSGAVDYLRAKQNYSSHADRYSNWISSGLQGDMKYLERGLSRRLDPTLVFPELKSVIAVLRPYPPHPVGTEDLRYARYLNGPDYHDTMKSSLEEAFQLLRARGMLPTGFQYKICVDTSAVLERTWAALCGLGWIGKNTLLIHPVLGSYVFIGVVFTNFEFGKAPSLLKDYCGNCTRCLSACPTEALRSHELDSKKCISYLTLEKRGEWEKEIPTAGFVAGCDLCQEACPYNLKIVKNTPVTEAAPYLITDVERLFGEDENGYLARIQGTALGRIKFPDFKRNLRATPRGSRK
jgi:epoxyqueuosine reductase